MTISPKFFWLMIAIYFVARLTLSGFNYIGDTSPEARTRALRHFDERELNLGIEYHRSGFGVSILSFILGQGFLILLVVGGISSGLAQRCLAWSGGRVWLQVPLYLTILLVVTTVLTLPFAYYQGFVLEHKFGFSKMNLQEWLVFQLKNAIVSWVLAVLIGSLAYALLRRFQTAWVWMLPIGALVLQVTLTFLFPKLFLPIFYKITPIEDPALITALTNVTDKVGVKLKKLYLINESKYSSHTNAFFTGFGKFKEVYLYDTLLKEHTTDEVAAILAHELGHWKHNHVLKGIILSELGIILACMLLYLFFPILQRSPFLKIGPLHDVSSLPMLLILAAITGFFTEPISNSVSRYFETQADEMGLELAPSPEVFVEDFKKLATVNRDFLLPHPLVVIWRYSHPPIVDRIERVEKALSAK